MDARDVRQVLLRCASILAEEDAPAAVDALARGLNRQTAGAKISAVRRLVAAIRDPGFAEEFDQFCRERAIHGVL